MIEAANVDLEPFFLDGTAGRLFALSAAPPSAARAERGVLIAPPFAEEMNKSRRQIALQMRDLAARGCRVLIPDLHGTGDSEGDFGDARWQIWLADLRTAFEWLAARGVSSIAILGVRLGALLALDFARSGTALPSRLVFWQAVTGGKLHLNQFLRLKVASAVMSAGGGLSVGDIRRDIDAGTTVEVAGYDLHPELVTRIDELEMAQMPPGPGSRVDWIEVTGSAGAGPGIATTRVLKAWEGADIDVRSHTVSGSSFWAAAEIAVVPALVEETSRLLVG